MLDSIFGLRKRQTEETVPCISKSKAPIKEIIDKINNQVPYDDLKLEDVCQAYPTLLTTPILINKSWFQTRFSKQISKICHNYISLGGYLLFKISNKNLKHLSPLIAHYNNPEDTTPYAVLLSYLIHDPKLLLKLLSPHDINMCDSVGRNLLYYCNEEKCKAILENYPWIDLNHKDNSGKTFVHAMIESKQCVPFEILQKYHYDFQCEDLFSCACKQQDIPFIRNLLKLLPELLTKNLQALFEYLSGDEIKSVLGTLTTIPDSICYSLVHAYDIKTIQYGQRIEKLTAAFEYLLTQPQSDIWIAYTDKEDNNVLHLLAERHLKHQLTMICSVCKELPLHKNAKGQTVTDLYAATKLERRLC